MPSTVTTTATGVPRAGSRPAGGRLSTRGLGVQFAGLTALNDIDLELHAGEILGLIGPNGAGKTTLVNALTGFQAHSGRLLLDDVDVTGHKPRNLSRAGVRRTFQNVRLFEEMTVIENIEVTGLGLGLSASQARHDAHELLEWFELTEHAHQPADSLPYGHERLLGIVRVMIAEPRFVLLDEPAAGLDESESDELLERLRAVPGRFGCGLMVIEHDMRMIMRLCDRLHVIDHGTTLAVGAADEIRTNARVIEAYLGTAATA